MGAISLLDYVTQTQDKFRAGVIQKFMAQSVFLKLLRFIPVDGFAYHYPQQTALPGVSFRNLGEQYPAQDKGVIVPAVENLKVFGGLIEVDRQLAMGDRGTQVRANAIATKVQAAGLLYDYQVINGDVSSDPKGFDGLKRRLIGDQVFYAGDNGDYLTLEMIDDLLDRVHGPNESKTLVMCKADRATFKQLVVRAAGGAAVADIGKRIETYDGASIVSLDEDDVPTAVIDHNETRGSSNVTSSIYCIRPGQDPEGEDVQGLVKGTMIEHEDQGVVGTTKKDLVEAVMGLGTFHGRSAARLGGILAGLEPAA